MEAGSAKTVSTNANPVVTFYALSLPLAEADFAAMVCERSRRLDLDRCHDAGLLDSFTLQQEHMAPAHVWRPDVLSQQHMRLLSVTEIAHVLVREACSSCAR